MKQFPEKRRSSNIAHLGRSTILLSGIFMLSLFIFGCGGGGSDIASGGSIITSSGTVTSYSLQWDAPTTNADGSALTDLAGYILHYGPGSGNYTYSKDVGNNTLVSLNTLGIQSGMWCFVLSAYDQSGNESSYSNEVCGDISI